MTRAAVWGYGLVLAGSAVQGLHGAAWATIGLLLIAAGLGVLVWARRRHA